MKIIQSQQTCKPIPTIIVETVFYQSCHSGLLMYIQVIEQKLAIWPI